MFFTGSVAVGRGVGETCARQLKGSVLELGGKDPMLVLADANLPNAVSGALWGGFANAGQTCAGIERVYVLREVADRFIEGVVAGAQRLRVGDPLDWTTQVGPMASRGAVRDRARAGRRRGRRRARSCAAAAPLQVPGLDAAAFYAPAVLTGVTHDMRIMREEMFGPVLPIVTVDSEDEAVALANDSRVRTRRVGLDARPRARRAHRARAGVGDGVDQRPHVLPRRLPVRVGRGEGLGPRPRALEVRLLRVRQRQAARVGARAGSRDFWWHPYDETLGRAVKTAARLLYGREADRGKAWREGGLALAKVAGRTLRRSRRR